MDSLSVEDNQLTFKDIEPNVGIRAFGYSPQECVPVQVIPGDATTWLVAHVGGASTRYQWLNKGVEMPDANDSVLAIWYDKDPNDYSARITNTKAADLTLSTCEAIPGSVNNAPAIIRDFQVCVNSNGSLVTIQYSLLRSSNARLAIVDYLGETVFDIPVDNNPGEHAMPFDVSVLPAGTYFLRLMTSAGAWVERIRIDR